jgi:hypothetical protein
MPTSSAATEQPEVRESENIAEIAAKMRAGLAHDYKAPDTRRDAHPHHTGLLQGKLIIEANLPAPLRVGLFAVPRTYETWIRCSSASGKPQADSVPDVRGFAVKVLDVPGDKIPESDEPRTQDFVCISIPTMPLGTVQLFRDIIVMKPLAFLVKMLFSGQMRVLRQLKASRSLPSSPLDIRYWSTTPYRFGENAIAKYSLIPQSHDPAPVPATRGDRYLTEALEGQLGKAGFAFDLAVQLRQGDLPVEDAAVLWPESDAPFAKVATLTIPSQVFRTPERDRLSEQLSFSPAHALVQHRPLGSINRARMNIYKTNSDFRHQRAGLEKLNR